MASKNNWIDLSLLGLCIVSLLGSILRTKFVFALPFINYNHLLEAHFHFAFGGWITLALMTLLTYDLLPSPFNKRPVYQWVLGAVAISAWVTLIASIAGDPKVLSAITSTFLILTTYIFSWVFTADMLKARLGRPVTLLALSSVVCLVLSSGGALIIAYMYISGAVDTYLYRHALLGYLHFQYNGFFSLAIFALLFNNIGRAADRKLLKSIPWFASLLSASIIPSLFLTDQWQVHNPWFRVMTMIGSLFILLSLFFFAAIVHAVYPVYQRGQPVIRLLVFVSMGFFMLKLLLQCLGIFPTVINIIFGRRPMVMGFLHMVFLGFVSLFLLAYMSEKGFLDSMKKTTRAGLLIFAVAVIFNEGLLTTQGMATLFTSGMGLFPWLLWVAGICLLAGALLIFLSRIRSR
ncbi:hypothetical protein Q4E93_09680 [Flavitalea sp. BT771]|uniref:hypothetical protein n=1 Tax=Flavitalea sp. BT771 TaxID=3063329 RepID=UPI0026E24F90|nr:hypothetical protein [Flavitalea sp. BT771]MDO6430860.1 hypothetical protein [Flavitalea sp. BT771]MDV6219000.1 hypothetical protein [Flavitalea sp. BT771]